MGPAFFVWDRGCDFPALDGVCLWFTKAFRVWRIGRVLSVSSSKGSRGAYEMFRSFLRGLDRVLGFPGS